MGHAQRESPAQHRSVFEHVAFLARAPFPVLHRRLRYLWASSRSGASQGGARLYRWHGPHLGWCGTDAAHAADDLQCTRSLNWPQVLGKLLGAWHAKPLAKAPHRTLRMIGGASTSLPRRVTASCAITICERRSIAAVKVSMRSPSASCI